MHDPKKHLGLTINGVRLVPLSDPAYREIGRFHADRYRAELERRGGYSEEYEKKQRVFEKNTIIESQVRTIFSKIFPDSNNNRGLIYYEGPPAIKPVSNRAREIDVLIGFRKPELIFEVKHPDTELSCLKAFKRASDWRRQVRIQRDILATLNPDVKAAIVAVLSPTQIAEIPKTEKLPVFLKIDLSRPLEELKALIVGEVNKDRPNDGILMLVVEDDQVNTMATKFGYKVEVRQNSQPRLDQASMSNPWDILRGLKGLPEEPTDL